MSAKNRPKKDRRKHDEWINEIYPISYDHDCAQK